MSKEENILGDATISHQPWLLKSQCFLESSQPPCELVIIPILQVKKLTQRDITASKRQGRDDRSELPTPRTVSMPRSLPPPTPPNWLSALPKSYLYTGQSASGLGDGQLLKARILVNCTRKFYSQSVLLNEELHTMNLSSTYLRKDLGVSASCLQTGAWTYRVATVPNTSS